MPETIQLPKPFSGGELSRRQRVTAPNASDVQRVGLQSDSGLRVPDMTSGGEGIYKAGQLAMHGLEHIGVALDRQQKEYDAIKTKEAELEFDRVSTAEFQRLQTEADTTDPQFVKDFDQWRESQRTRIMGSLPKGVSDYARSTLDLSLQQKNDAYESAAGKLHLTAAQLKSQDLIQQQTNIYAAQVARDPSSLDIVLQQADDDLGRFAGTMNPNVARDARSGRRKAIIESAINGMVDSGQYDQANQLINGKAVGPDGKPVLDEKGVPLGKFDQDLDQKARERISNNIDRGQRMAIARAEHQANIAERDLKRGQAANEATLMVGMDSGKDVPDTLLRAAVLNRQISDAGYRMLTERKVKGAEGTDNPAVLIDLQTKMVRDGEDIHDLIIQQRNNKQLSSTTTGKLIEENQRRIKSENKEEFATADEKAAFGYMSRYLGADKLAFAWDDDTGRRVATAQREFRDRMSQGKETPQAIADDLVLKFAKNDPLPQVGYIGGTDTTTPAGIKEAGEKLRGLRDAGRITEDAYTREMNVLRQYAERVKPPAAPNAGTKK